jgi:hypothetical protein
LARTVHALRAITRELERNYTAGDDALVVLSWRDGVALYGEPREAPAA